MTRLVLIRHGESVAQVEQVVMGHGQCRGLSPLGRRQAELLRDRLSRTGEIHADVILTSELQRAIETATIVAPAIGGATIVRDCDLCEMHAGEAEGMDWREVQERWPGDGWGPGMGVAPGGETWEQFEARVAGALRRYAEEHEGRTIVAFVHGGVIGHTWRAMRQLEMLPMAEIRNTSITEWVHMTTLHTERAPEWHLARFNDAAHLEGLQ